MDKLVFRYKIIILTSFLLFFMLSTGYCQKFILLQKGSNQKTRLKYEIGDELIYKTKNFDFYFSDIIVDIKTDIIVLTENVLRPQDITAVYIKNKDPRNKTIKNLSFLGMGAGLIFFTGGIINSLYQEGDLSQASNSLGWSAGLFGVGFLISKLQYKEFKHEGRNKIQIIILYED